MLFRENNIKKRILGLTLTFIPFIGFNTGSNSFHSEEEKLRFETPVTIKNLTDYKHKKLYFKFPDEKYSLENHYEKRENKFFGFILDGEVCNQDYSGQDLSGWDFSNRLLVNVIFDNCNLTHTNFSRTVFKNVSCKDARFNDNFKFRGLVKQNTIIKGMESTRIKSQEEEEIREKAERYYWNMKTVKDFVFVSTGALLITGTEYSLQYINSSYPDWNSTLYTKLEDIYNLVNNILYNNTY